MTRQVMRRDADDNEYLHRDFHGALSAGIQYLHENFGEDAVRDYLWQFARAFYAPLTADIQHRGLVALEEHFRSMYSREGGDVQITRSGDQLWVEVRACPAVNHMRKHGYVVAQLFHETTNTVNRAICHDTPFDAELLEYDETTGAGTQRFYRRNFGGADSGTLARATSGCEPRKGMI